MGRVEGRRRGEGGEGRRGGRKGGVGGGEEGWLERRDNLCDFVYPLCVRFVSLVFWTLVVDARDFVDPV